MSVKPLSQFRWPRYWAVTLGIHPRLPQQCISISWDRSGPRRHGLSYLFRQWLVVAWRNVGCFYKAERNRWHLGSRIRRDCPYSLCMILPPPPPPGYPLKWRQPRAISSHTEFSDLLQLFILFWPFLTLMSPYQNDVVFQVFSRHQSQDGTRWPQHEVMLQLNAEVDRLQQQYHVRIIGENGVAKGIIDLVNPIETW